jgi:hypothetical protein
LDFHRVHGNRVFTDDHPEVFYLANLEDTLLGLQIKIVLCKDAQNIVYNSSVQGGVIWGVDEDVVHIDRDVSLVDQITEDVVHHGLEGRQGIREAKEHDHQFE